MDNNQIRKYLEDLADEKYKNFHKGLCPGTTDILGVRVPVLRNFSKELSKQDFKKYLDNAVNNSYEEILLQGLVIGYSKMSLKEYQMYLERFIPKINNWAVCDVTVSGLKFIKKYNEDMWRFIQKYLKSEKEFELRFAIVTMLDFYITEDYIERVLEIINNIKSEAYYVKMAVAWTIQVAFVKFQDKTMKFLQNNKLDNWTYNKALQKIIESYRVNESTKKKIKCMKR